MVQVRGRDEDGNMTHVGSWVDVPRIAAVLRCDNNKLAAVVDKGKIYNANKKMPELANVVNSLLHAYLNQELCNGYNHGSIILRTEIVSCARACVFFL